MATCCDKDARFIEDGKHFLLSFRARIFPAICTAERSRVGIINHGIVASKIRYSLLGYSENITAQLLSTHRMHSDFTAEFIDSVWVNPKIRLNLMRVESCVGSIYRGVPAFQAVVAIHCYKPLEIKIRLVLDLVEARRACIEKTPVRSIAFQSYAKTLINTPKNL